MLRLLIGVALALSAALGLAGEAQRVQVIKTMDINAPAAEVWNLVKDFSGLHTWHPGIAKDEIVEGKDNEVGAVRLLTAGNGNQLREKLLGYDAAGMNFKYGIIEGGGLPVTNYESIFKVEAISDGTSKVTWTGSFTPIDTGPAPAPAPGAEPMTPAGVFESIYQAGLDNLKKLAETK